MKKVLWIVLLLGIITTILYFEGNQSFQKYTNEDFQIETYQSRVDKDLDGIEDQADILQGVKDYLGKKPKYKSKYYETGYPNDQFGVCTDVVAFGLKSAGYDLMELVYEDVKKHQEDYSIKTIDKRIDFRRVRNLIIYFQKNTISLTTNIEEIDKWQGGDIVIFKKHIGIVSEHRNKKGIPYVYHHANPYQKNYEEDILPYRKDIVGHYRMS